MFSSGEYQVQVKVFNISDKSYFFLFLVLNQLNTFTVMHDNIRNMEMEKRNKNMFIFWSGKHEIYLKLRYSCIHDSYLDSFQIQT